MALMKGGVVGEFCHLWICTRKMKVTGALVWLLGVVLPAANALYSSKDAVIQLTLKNFKKEVLDTEHVVIAEFFAPWCGHCQKLVPEYKKAAEKLKGLAKVVAVDCDDKQNQPLCSQYGVKGFPTIKIFPGGVKGLPQDYQGPRTAKGLVDAAIAKIPNNVLQIGGSGKRGIEYDAFLAQQAGELDKVILVSQKPSTPPLYKALSTEYKNRLILGEVKSSAKDILEKLNVTNIPSVILIPKDSGQPILYEGPLKHAGLVKFLDKYALAKKDAPSEKKAGEKSSKGEAAAPKPIEVKSQSTFDAECIEKSGFCVLAFFAVEPEYEESVKEHTNNLSLLEDIAKLHPGYRYLWFNTLEKGKNFMRTVQMGDSLPGLMALNGKKKAYRLLTGPFDKDAINEFLTEVSNAKGRFFKLDVMPSVEDKIVRATDEL
ncbi:hypothetical protein SpCBS45565_g00488 [Spizellomyces sp. 'palustris']|nr:hypothetical protein SpCBS45565_g00488 [Spizellomyces sp. 'palustris']